MNFDPSLPGSYKYVHYSKKTPEQLDLSRAYPQPTINLIFHTPNGLWLSVPGEYDWVKYCVKNNFKLEYLESRFEIVLKPAAKILVLHNESVFKDFFKRFGIYEDGIENHGLNYDLDVSILWQHILSNYQGIVAPILLPKMYDMILWNNAWPCTSGCIWDLRAVEKAVKLV
jgi:hypothetical protein